MSGDTGRFARVFALRTIMNTMDTKMAEETPVRDHMIKLIGLFREMEFLGMKIREDVQVDMVLETLPDSFIPFKLSYYMRKMVMTLPELMNQLHMAEGILKPTWNVQDAETNSSSPSSYKEKNKNVDKLKVQSQGSIGKKDGKPKGKCFHCGEKGHWKTNCPGWWLKKLRCGKKKDEAKLVEGQVAKESHV